MQMLTGPALVALAVFIVAIIVVNKAIRVVPQQRALVIERWGKFHEVLEPGLRFVVPFVDRVAYRHDLREIPLDVPSQICITKDNTQLQVDGILYFQVTDPRLAPAPVVARCSCRRSQTASRRRARCCSRA